MLSRRLYTWRLWPKLTNRHHVRSRILIGITLALSALLVLGTATASLFTLQRMQTTFGWVRHTQQVLIAVDELDKNIVNAVATQRSYQLTKESNRLQDFRSITAEIYAGLDDLGDLIADNASQSPRLALIRGLIEQWLSRIGAGLEKAGQDTTEARLVDDLARQGRLSIGNALQQFRNSEVALLDQRQEQAERVTQISTLLGISTLLLGLLTAGLGIWLIQTQRAETRIRNMQAEFIEISKDTIVSETATIVAHEINQPLTAIRNYLGVARRMVDPETPQPARLSDVLNSALAQIDRATEILRHLRNFGGRLASSHGPEPVGQMIEDSIAVSALDWDGVRIVRDISPELPEALINRVHIQQVLVNLMRNALEAMVHTENREVIISARRAEDDMIRISVSDSGPGMQPEVVDKLFRPFVTTKETGMGVGLSICRRIIEAHGGRIGAANGETGGAVFEFTVPAAKIG